MPGSSTRDSSPSSSSGRKGRNKRKQKLTAGDAAGSKKKDKNVKDTGGVVAAVTKHAKFSYVVLHYLSTPLSLCLGYYPPSS